jgi:hypothetical protein
VPIGCQSQKTFVPMDRPVFLGQKSRFEFISLAGSVS